MARAPQNTVPLITQAVVLRYYQRLPGPGESAYYVLETGPSRIPWCALRVQRTQIQIGLRKGNSWSPIGVASRLISLDDVKGGDRIPSCKDTRAVHARRRAGAPRSTPLPAAVRTRSLRRRGEPLGIKGALRPVHTREGARLRGLAEYVRAEGSSRTNG